MYYRKQRVISGQPKLVTFDLFRNEKFETPSKFVDTIVRRTAVLHPGLWPVFIDYAYFGYAHGYKFVAFQCGLCIGVLINGEKLWLYYFDRVNFNWSRQTPDLTHEYLEPMMLVIAFFRNLETKRTDKAWRFTKKVAEKLFPDPSLKKDSALVCNRWNADPMKSVKPIIWN